MKIPLPDEVAIEGRWVFVKGKMVADEAALRIEVLTASYLEFVAAVDGWQKVYRDPKDGRLWEQTYPQGEMHGGGPPRLAVISSEEARRRYTLSASKKADPAGTDNSGAAPLRV
ncbi:MAG TPA: Imm27 family immunity protein [Opitutaceae bacterium]